MAVTQKRAETTLARLKEVYATYLTEQVIEGETYPPLYPPPVLVQDWAWSGSPAPFAILWEEGPSDWALHATSGDPSEEDYALHAQVGSTPKGRKPLVPASGVYAEPITSWALGLYAA